MKTAFRDTHSVVVSVNSDKCLRVRADSDSESVESVLVIRSCAFDLNSSAKASVVDSQAGPADGTVRC